MHQSWAARPQYDWGHLAEIDTVFTDKPLPDDLTRKCAEWETKVHLA